MLKPNEPHHKLFKAFSNRLARSLLGDKAEIESSEDEEPTSDADKGFGLMA